MKHSLSLAKLLQCQSIYLKNKVLFSVSFQIQLHKWKITHMWSRWGTPQNFLLAFIDELWKTWKIRILKKWKKKLLEISFYTCARKATIIWSTVPEIELDIFFCHFGPFFALLSPTLYQPRKPKFWKTEKSVCRCYHLKLVQQKTRSYDVCLLRYGVQQKIFCHFRPFFAILSQYWPWKLKFGKNVKNSWKCYPFTHVYHKSRSYDVWFLRYKMQSTELFIILGHIFPLTLQTTQKIKILKKQKKHFILMYVSQMMIIRGMVPEISSTIDRMFCHFRLFFAFYPLTTQKIKILKKWKNLLEVLSF